MTEPSVADRLRGTHERIGANRPFMLDEPERVHFVERGHLDVFAVESRQGEAVGRRRFVARIPVGELAFGSAPWAVLPPAPHPSTAGEGARMCLLAVPSQDAVVVRGERAGIDDKSFDLAATVWVDKWVERLAGFAARERAAPRHTHLLEADPHVPIPAGAILTAQHRDVIWVTAAAELRYLERRDRLAVPAGHLLPMTERTWLVADEDTQVTAMYTPAALLSGRLWPALDSFGTLVLRLAAAADKADASSDSERRIAATRARQASAAGAFDALGAVLRPKQPAEPGAAERPSPVDAARLVAESLGVALDADGARAAADSAGTLRALAGRGRMHMRFVTLGDAWWKRAGTSMVGFRDRRADGGDRSQSRIGEEAQIALLSDDAGSYQAVDPASGAATRVDARVAAAIHRQAVVFYPHLPEAVRSMAQLVRFALHGRWPDFRTIILSTVLASLAAMVAPIVTGQFLVEVVPRGEAAGWFAVIGALVAVALGAGVFEVVRALAMLRVQSRFDDRAANAVWGRVMSLPIGFFRDYSAGDLAMRASGTRQICQTVATASAAVTMGVFSSIFSLAVLFYLSWQMAILVAVLLLAQSAAVWLLALGKLRHERRAQQQAGELSGFVFQMLRGLAKLRVANAESLALDRWAHRYGSWRRETLASQNWGAGADALLAAAQPLTLAGIFAIASALLQRDAEAFDLAMFLSFHAAFGQFSAAVSSLTSTATSLTSIVPAIERLRPILDTAPEPRHGIDPGDLKGDIEFDDVTFRYAPDAPNAVEDIAFRVPQGDYVAFVGPSGCGKSTLFALLLGFEHPSAGTVFLDGHNLSSLDLHAVRGRLGVVLQNSRVMAGSIYENIAGTAPLTLDEAWAAAGAAAIDDDIHAMPMGMHTRLPEGGASLSAGQRQRLLIARALALKPRILLFDEATSALDNRSQDRVQASLKDLGITRLVIAHRLSSIRHVDRIYALDKGRIVESGSYAELMRAGGMFAALATRQLVGT